MTSKNNITEFWRECPKCHERVYHTSTYNRDIAVKRMKPCFSCAQNGVQYPKQIDLPNGIVGTMPCKSCGETCSYTSARVFHSVYRRSLEIADVPTCQSCAAKTQRQNPTEKQRKQWKTWGKTATQNRKIAGEIHREERGMTTLTRSCPTCDDEITHTTLYACWHAREMKFDCMSCSAQKKWDAIDSPYRTKEFYDKTAKAWKTIGNVSKGERDLAEHLTAVDTGFVLNEFTVRIGPYFPDIIHAKRKLLVEYYGDGVHGNPTIFKAEDMLMNKSYSASQAWERDAKRQLFLEQSGWRFEVVWASEWKKTPIVIIDRIKALIA